MTGQFSYVCTISPTICHGKRKVVQLFIDTNDHETPVA
jgi:hypothetical protein